nr:MAG TPA: hypothetical protein [Caudoviricetes sp.]
MDSKLYHSGVKGMKWGIRRYQNADGTLTEEGRARYGANSYQEMSPSQRANFDKDMTTRSDKLKRNTAIGVGLAATAASAAGLAWYLTKRKEHGKRVLAGKKAAETRKAFETIRVKDVNAALLQTGSNSVAKLLGKGFTATFKRPK